MKLKNLIRIILLVAVLLLLTIVPVNAVISNNGAFDSDYYVNSYEDLKAAYGNNTAASYDHFVITGLNEWRRPSITFDAKVYLEKNPDVAQALGNNPRLAYEHFLASGMAEHRVASNEFNVDIYLANYADVKAVYGNNMASVYNQYVYSGIAEGRVADRLVAGAEDHEHKYDVFVEYVVEPTCQKNGEAIYKCACGEVAPETVVVPASEDFHDWQEDERSEAATCVKDGKLVSVCTICKEEKEEVIEASDEYHNYKKKTTANGSEVWECTYCHDLYTEGVVCEHNYKRIGTTATCTKSGVETLRCTKCGDEKTERVSALGHNVDINNPSTLIIKEATCTTDGKASGKCTRCDVKGVVEMVIPAAHTYINAVDNKEATCTEPGRLSQICTKCSEDTPGHKIYEITPAKGHTVPEDEKDIVICEGTPTPTTDKDGNSTYVKDDNGEIIYTAVKGNTVDLSKTTTRELNKKLCTKGIVRVYTCPDCKTEVIETIYDVKGHNFRVTTNATCTANGTKECTICEATETIPATGHDLTGGYLAENKDGTYSVKCNNKGCKTLIIPADQVHIADKATEGTVDTIMENTTAKETWNVAVTYKDTAKTEIDEIRITNRAKPCVHHNLKTLTHTFTDLPAVGATGTLTLTCKANSEDVTVTYTINKTDATKGTIKDDKGDVWDITIATDTKILTVGDKK